MARYIATALVIFLVLTIVFVVIYISYKSFNPKTPISIKKYRETRELVDNAASLLRSLQFPDSTNMMDSTILSKEHRTLIASWLNKYREAND